ncbi:MAG: ABC transporter permease [Chloroflexota bacterium]|nr:ABC transporter permease [Chloroflexota bacterium]NOG63328.1 ABC transporter permease [Chloroflexota bacterium]GIK64588.1 MAG: ABC transporter permease [Chloroflexota bacterium]
MAIVRRFLNTSKLVNISLNITLLLLAVGAALLVGSVMIMLMDADPIKAYQALYEGAFGTTNSRAETLVKATPLLFVGIGICVAFRGGVINVGGEGQMIIGALAGVWIALSLDTVPRFIENVPINDFPQITVVTLSLLAGFLAGALWGGIAGVLKAYFGVNEILSTIMLNQIALQLMNYLLNGVLLDPEQKDRVNRIPKTARIEEHAKLPRIDWFSDTPTRLHAGLIVGLALAVVVYILLWRTTLGYRIRAVGQSDRASRYAGINVKRQVLYSILISGGCAGLAGAVQVIGLQYRLQTDGSAAGFTGNAGFNGIVAALFGGLHPVGTIPASVFFGALLIGAQSIQREVQVPASLITTLNGLVVIFVVSTQIFTKRLTKRRASVPPQPTPATPKSLPALQEEAAK